MAAKGYVVKPFAFSQRRNYASLTRAICSRVTPS